MKMYHHSMHLTLNLLILIKLIIFFCSAPFFQDFQLEYEQDISMTMVVQKMYVLNYPACRSYVLMLLLILVHATGELIE